MKKYIYLTGGWGYGNRGDNAILAGMIQTIKENIDSNDYELLITSFSAKETTDHNNVETVESVHKIMTKRHIANIWHRFAFWLWEKTNHKILISAALKKHLDCLRKSKVLVMGGGGYFNDAWPDMLMSKYAEIKMAKHVGCPVVMYGQTVGPFSNNTIKDSLTEMLTYVSAIAYRDIQTEDVLKRCNYNLNKTAFTADEANLLKKAEKSFFAGFEGKIIIGVMIQNFRPHLGVAGTTGSGYIKNSRQYYSEILTALNAVLANLTCHVVFITSTDWDAKSNINIFENITLNARSTKAYLENLTTKDFIVASQQVDLMVSTNMHPVILAATGSKPSVAISYHYKLDDYMKSIGLEDLIVRIDDFTASDLEGKIKNAICNRVVLGDLVKERHAGVKKLANKNYELLSSFLN